MVVNVRTMNEHLLIMEKELGARSKLISYSIVRFFIKHENKLGRNTDRSNWANMIKEWDYIRFN